MTQISCFFCENKFYENRDAKMILSTHHELDRNVFSPQIYKLSRISRTPAPPCVSPYSAILSRKPSTSSRMLAEKNLGNSVDEGVRDSGGMCLRAFLRAGRERQKDNTRDTRHKTQHCLVTGGGADRLNTSRIRTSNNSWFTQSVNDQSIKSNQSKSLTSRDSKWLMTMMTFVTL